MTLVFTTIPLLGSIVGKTTGVACSNLTLAERESMLAMVHSGSFRQVANLVFAQQHYYTGYLLHSKAGGR